jgi:hypothetical protein
VIYIDLSVRRLFSIIQMTLRVNHDVQDVSGPTYSDLIEGFKDEVVTISENLQALGHFNNHSSLSRSEVAFLDGVLNRTLPGRQWPGALARLCKIVQKLTRREVVLLVDEYNTPTSRAIQHGFLSEVRALPSLTSSTFHSFVGYGFLSACLLTLAQGYLFVFNA